MGQKCLQTPHQRKYIDGKKAYEKMLHNIHHQGNAIKTMRYHCMPIRMVKIQNTGNTKC